MKWFVNIVLIFFTTLGILLISSYDIYAEDSTTPSCYISVEVKDNDDSEYLSNILRCYTYGYDNSYEDKIQVFGFVNISEQSIISTIWAVSTERPAIESLYSKSYENQYGVQYFDEHKSVGTIYKYTVGEKTYYGVTLLMISSHVYEPQYIESHEVVMEPFETNIYYTDKNYDLGGFLTDYFNNELDYPIDDYEPDGNGGYKPIIKDIDDSIPLIPRTCFSANAYDEITDKDFAYVLMNFTADFNSDYGLYYDVIWGFDTVVFNKNEGMIKEHLFTDTWNSNVILDMNSYYSSSSSKYVLRDISSYDWLCSEIHKEIELNNRLCITCATQAKNGHKHIGTIKDVTIRVAYYDKITKKRGKTTKITITFEDGQATEIVIDDEDNPSEDDIIPNPPSDDDSSTSGDDLIDDTSFLNTLNNLLKLCQRVFSLFKNLLSFLPSWVFANLLLLLPFIVVLRVMGR